ncbi:hypothetical protein [Jatrophihabitans sp.]|uniref:hypothetical protein n=1 Tax=Jatrophihabitans sp. TaxID=1932789 RepID=UPI002C4B8534|nr:hypothetical protein [Jatrophihabitans sp.]
MTGRRIAAALAGTLLACAACVGPATTTSVYRGKAGHTAEDALSQLETARLAVETDRRGNLLHASLEVMLTEAEDGFSSIQATFDSIQPPDSTEADQLRDKLDKILAAGSDGLAQLRIAARRGDSAVLYSTSAELGAVSEQLQAFSDNPHA